MNLQKVADKRVFYILVGTLILLFVLLLSLLSKKRVLDQQNLTQYQQGTGQDQNQGLPPQSVSFPFPRTVASDYTLNTDLPTLPDSVKLSDLKTSYTTGEALDLATKIGFTNAVVNDGTDVIFVTDQDENQDQQGLLTISKTTGNWVIVTEKGYPSGASDPTSAARSFLQKLGVWDDTLVVSSTYKRASYPGLTFVEIHRSWEGLGMPLINPLGAMNLTETERLADVKLGYIENATPDDPDVTESSDGFPGKTRPNQFNTITVGVADESNNVMNVTSNIKLFSKTLEKSSSQSLKTPEEALEELKSGKTSFSLAKPSGEGVIEIQNVFPGNQVELQNAVINEVMLTYIDEVGQKTQSTLYPYYLFRGTATSSTGYQVQFVQTVLALKDINTLGVFAQNSQVTVFPGQGSTLQYGTFNWLSPAPNPNQSLACAGLTQIFQLPNGAYIGWFPQVPERSWYYVPAPGETVDAAKMLEIKKILRWEAAKACKGSINDPAICAYSDATVNLQTACYYLGTGSPFIYVYTKTPKQMQISLPQSVSYADPVFSQEKTWSFTASPDQTLTFSNGLTRQKLYWEFDKQVLESRLSSLKKNSQGFVVDKNSLGEFADSVSQKLGLNLQEKESLLVELTREANKLTSKTLKVGLLERKTLDEVIPVSIEPQPQSYHRVIFYVTSAGSKDHLETPTLQKLTRAGDTVVEVGVLGF